MELVADEDDRHALLRQRAQDPEELERFLRRQHRRRLVEDQDLGAPVERLQDLDPLLLADADVLDARVRVDGEVERTARSALTRSSAASSSSSTFSRVGSIPSTMFSATVITGISMKCWCTIPIPRSIASARRADLDRFPVDQDLALVRAVEAVEDVHQRGLAGAVLAEERVHLASPQVEVDVVVRDDAWETLRDALQLEERALGQP